MKCRLCRSDSCMPFAKDTIREYVRCENCTLIFVPDYNTLSSTEEKERYSHHNNTRNNEEYVTYLTKFTNELQRIPLSHPKILDYGCGENAVLTDILKRSGIDCKAYDPLYTINEITPNSTFDIIIMCEVIEHMRSIRNDVHLLTSLLSRTGYIIIKSELLEETREFTNWWYTKDQTHINFFSTLSIQAFSELLGMRVIYSGERNIVILKQV